MPLPDNSKPAADRGNNLRYSLHLHELCLPKVLNQPQNLKLRILERERERERPKAGPRVAPLFQASQLEATQNSLGCRAWDERRVLILESKTANSALSWASGPANTKYLGCNGRQLESLGLLPLVSERHRGHLDSTSNVGSTTLNPKPYKSRILP